MIAGTQSSSYKPPGPQVHSWRCSEWWLQIPPGMTCSTCLSFCCTLFTPVLSNISFVSFTIFFLNLHHGFSKVFRSGKCGIILIVAFWCPFVIITMSYNHPVPCSRAVRITTRPWGLSPLWEICFSYLLLLHAEITLYIFYTTYSEHLLPRQKSNQLKSKSFIFKSVLCSK